MADRTVLSAACCAIETIHITDQYFFEEFKKSMGQDACHEWLRILSNGGGVARRSSSSSSSSSLRSLTPTSALPTPYSGPKTPNQEPIHSLCLSSPLHTQQCEQASSSHPPTERATQAIRSMGNLNIGNENKSDIRMMIDGRTSSLPGFSKIGLLYTDAAHSVLQDQEVADFIKRSKSALS